MKKHITVCGLLLLMLILGACDMYAMAGEYPFDRASEWNCEEIDFEIQFIYNDSGQLLAEQNSGLCWNNETLEVSVGFHVDYFIVNIDGDQDVITEPLLKGTWKYQDNKMIFYISEDYLLDGAYSKLTFVPNGQ